MKKDEGSDALYQLIHRLDANEKGYVKKYLKRTSSKGNTSLKILLVIEKQSVYNEVALKKIFKNYAVVKVHTWDAVMDALSIYNKNQSLTSELNHAYNKFSILHSKGLTEECKRLLDKAIQRCYDNEEYHALIKFLALRSNLSREFKNPKQDLENYELYARQIQSAIKRLNEIYLFSDELTRLFYLQLDLAKSNNLSPISEFYLSSTLSKTEPSSKQALKLKDDFLAIYYYLHQDYAASVKHMKRSLDFVEMKMEKSGYFDYNFISSSKNLLTLFLQLNQYESAQKVLNNLQKQAVLNSTFKKIQKGDIYHYQLYIFNQSNQLNKLKEYLQENDTKIIEAIWDYPNEPFRNNFQVHYLISLLLLKKYKDAVRWILQCNNDKCFRDNFVIFQYAELIELTLHFRLGDSESAIKKAKSVLSSKVELGDSVALFKALAISDKTKRIKTLTDAIEAIKELNKDEANKSHVLLKYFDVLVWMEEMLDLK